MISMRTWPTAAWSRSKKRAGSGRRGSSPRSRQAGWPGAAARPSRPRRSGRRSLSTRSGPTTWSSTRTSRRPAPSRTGSSSSGIPMRSSRARPSPPTRAARSGSSSTSAASTAMRTTGCLKAVQEVERRNVLRGAAGGRRPPLVRAAARRRRLHLWRGNRDAQLDRGEARRAALQAPLPGPPRSLRPAHRDQQRRDARVRARDPGRGRRRVPRARHGGLARHQALRRVGPRHPARRLRDPLRDDAPRR